MARPVRKRRQAAHAICRGKRAEPCEPSLGYLGVTLCCVSWLDDINVRGLAFVIKFRDSDIELYLIILVSVLDENPSGKSVLRKGRMVAAVDHNDAFVSA